MAKCSSGAYTDSITFENENEHQAILIEGMKSMYDDRQLVDVIICIEEKEFFCHRNVLAATSPYFKAMFTTALTESKQDRINIYELDATSFGLIVQYAYTGCLEITKTNVQNVLGAASLLQISAIHKAAAKFMELQLDASNCIGINCFAHVHNCTELQNKAQEFIEKQFVEVSQGEEFLFLGPAKLTEILTSNELNVEKEEIVFEALMRWVLADQENHTPHLSNTLLPLIRFGLLHSRYIQDVIATHPIITACPQSKQLIENIKICETNPDNFQDSVFSVILRSGMIKPEHCLLLVGGVGQSQSQSKPSINCFNPVTREAYNISNFHDEGKVGYYDVEDPACVVTDDNHIFVAGGNYVYRNNLNCDSPSDDSFDEYDEETVRKDFYQFDNDHDCWILKSPMLFPKSNFTLVSADGQIYCFGGLTVNQHPTEIIEKYDIGLNRWSYVGMMPTTLVDLSSIVHQNLIYILGGRTGVGAHNIVMRYDPRKTEWTSLAGMPTPRFNFGVCVVNDEIYVAGGQIYSHTSHTINREALSSVEIYNVEENQWRQGPNLPNEIYNVGMFHTNSSIIVCGTTEHHRSAYRIVRYIVVYRMNLAKSKWEEVESDLCDIRDYSCVAAKMHTRKLSQVFRPEVDT